MERTVTLRFSLVQHENLAQISYLKSYLKKLLDAGLSVLRPADVEQHGQVLLSTGKMVESKLIFEYYCYQHRYYLSGAMVPDLELLGGILMD